MSLFRFLMLKFYVLLVCRLVVWLGLCLVGCSMNVVDSLSLCVVVRLLLCVVIRYSLVGVRLRILIVLV